MTGDFNEGKLTSVFTYIWSRKFTYILAKYITFKFPVLDIDNFVPVSSSNFPRSFDVVHFLHQSTFISPSWAVWQLRGSMLFTLAYYCLYRRTWYFQAFGNCSQGWTTLVEVYIFFWGLGWFILILPWCQAKSHWVWKLALKYSHRYMSNWLKWCQLSKASKAMT
jgi:hypothetical protein